MGPRQAHKVRKRKILLETRIQVVGDGAMMVTLNRSSAKSPWAYKDPFMVDKGVFQKR